MVASHTTAIIVEKEPVLIRGLASSTDLVALAPGVDQKRA